MNLPNILTLVRLFLVPLFVAVFYKEDGMRVYSSLIFIVASLTDVLDGYLARKLNLSTKWGQLMDPLADKCMQLAVILTLFSVKLVPAWFLILLVLKELMLICGGIFLYSKKTYVKANHAGKLNTVFLFVVMTLILLLPSMNGTVKNILLGISALLTLLAGITYLYLYFVHNQSFKQYTSKNKKGESA
ncbi:MAG: CDP-diacylglycerol--glycerol-3-phosphate 3-phosphatidyltransferase [Ruminococcaceae bacterium]|nr:CDP-diacylglycerol--glycerol-3-phosphate 3-phosphatidyltransferase [Oscillospiraceae bacterium]